MDWHRWVAWGRKFDQWCGLGIGTSLGLVTVASFVIPMPNMLVLPDYHEKVASFIRYIRSDLRYMVAWVFLILLACKLFSVGLVRFGLGVIAKRGERCPLLSSEVASLHSFFH